jgi:hypothetical protein
LANFVQPRYSALIFHGVVQQRGDHLIFSAAVLDHNSGHAQQMPHVRLTFAFAPLVLMQFRRVTQRFHETLRQHWRFRWCFVGYHDSSVANI